MCFVNNEMTHDTVRKRYQCPPYEKEGGECSVIFRRTPVSLVISLCWLNLTSQCLVWYVFHTLAIRNAFSVDKLHNSIFKHFLQASHDLRIINGRKNISGEKVRK